MISRKMLAATSYATISLEKNGKIKEQRGSQEWMVTTSGKRQLSHQSQQISVYFSWSRLCHMVTMSWRLGKEVFLPGQFAASPKFSPIDKIG